MEQQKLISLVSAAQQGDGEALNELFNTFYNDVYYFALKTLNNNADLACDITQETFIEVISTIGDLRQPGAFVTWMKKITYHQCTRYFKKKKETLVDEGEDGYSIFDELAEERAEFIPNEAMDQEDFRNTILKMIDTLPEEQRSAVMLYYYDELTTKTISEIQGISEGTVKSRLNYARKAIKRSVEDYEKKNDVRLHSVGLFPLIAWLFSGGAETVPAAALPTIAEGITAATGTAITVGTSVATVTTATATATAAAAGSVATASSTATAATGTGILAKITAIPLAVKIIAGITAASVVIGSIVPAILPDDTPTEPTITLQTEATNPTVTTTPPITTDPPVTEPDVTKPPATEPIETEPPVTEPTITTIPVSEAGGIIEEGCTYIMADGTVLSAGEAMPMSISNGDEYISEDYTYKYGYSMNGEPLSGLDWEYDEFNGWGVRVNSLQKTEYAQLLPKINGSPLVNMRQTFYECRYLTTPPVIPHTVTNMEHTFGTCYSLATAPEIPHSVVTMDSTFSSCWRISDAPEIPSSVTNLSCTFYDCRSLIGIAVIDADPTEFKGCFVGTSNPIALFGTSEKLSYLATTSENDNITVPETAGTWGDDALWNYDWSAMSLNVSGTGVLPESIPTELTPLFPYIQTLSIESGITEFNLDSFEKFTALITLEIPDSVIDIYEEYPKIPTLQCFIVDKNNTRYCSDEYGVLYNRAMTAVDRVPWGLKGDYIVPSSVTYLSPAYSMTNCHSLTNIYIGPNVTDLDDWGDWEYFQCDNLLGIWVNQDNPNYCNDEFGVLFNKDMTSLLRMPCGFEGDYVVPNGVTEIGFCSFDSCQSLTSITIPDTVERIQECAFFNCTNLTSLSFPASVTSYGWRIVSGCSNLKEIRFSGSPGWLTYETYRVFAGITTTVYYPAENQDWSDFSPGEANGITWVAY